ncbi:hypothetical protein [Alloyangia pacifica]|uniref:hypothetical protein n=1 Tax=Alloyangia pacifica TaxID=311180 RepID=UPI0031D4DC9D
MTTTRKALNPHPPEFERFLYAPVGEDRNGYVVTVLSALARLGLDPWTETAELVTLRREAARLRLGKLLSRFRDVPALVANHKAVADELSLLLPENEPRSLQHTAATVTAGGLGGGVSMWAIVALILVLAQIMFGGLPVIGE